MPYVNSKATDQPVWMCRMISIFVIDSLDRIILVVSISKTLRLNPASEAEQAGLTLIVAPLPRQVFS